MSHGHKHGDRQEPHHAENHPHHNKPASKKWHQDWRVVTVAILMIICMLIYVFSLDDALRPGRKGNQPAQPVPVAAP